MVARTSAEAMPALSAHWLLSKRHASLMAIFYAVLVNRGTRLRDGQTTDLCADFGSAVAPRSKISRRTEYEGIREAMRWLVREGFCQGGTYGHTKNEAELSWWVNLELSKLPLVERPATAEVARLAKRRHVSRPPAHE